MKAARPGKTKRPKAPGEAISLDRPRRLRYEISPTGKPIAIPRSDRGARRPREGNRLVQIGFIGIIGRPNVGKSTLLNAVVGERIAITTPKPQTTRNRITGIRNVPNGQMIFLDTPGIHRADTPLNQLMVGAATDAFRTADLLLLLVEAPAGVHRGDLAILRGLEKVRRPVILVINKTDLVGGPSRLTAAFREAFHFADARLSALKERGIDALLDTLWQLSPKATLLPQPDDGPLRALRGQDRREQVILRRTIPYSTAVVVDTFREDGRRN